MDEGGVDVKAPLRNVILRGNGGNGRRVTGG